ncbi:rubrerythrin [Oikeobacillus pervagus]|uniref:Rubrerythrin n=1 Tax=Oikeobacillus pervagus TaxID=1325931 RepID=A0AAJ1WLF5_9BACI|nr:ferritin-like domain-containing protein [Oikeobacillus pervagus]MDQ0216136.1 rubrerythrin [Oikeobacillus pervagus]
MDPYYQYFNAPNEAPINFYDYSYDRKTHDIVSLFQKAINGEYTAIQCYGKIANMAPNPEERNQIIEIKQDEIRHLRQFTQMYTTLTGRKPTPQMTERCPTTYREGLHFSVKDEQETVDFYLDLAEMVSDQKMKQIIQRAAADEQNHAVWFLYYLFRLKR